VAGRFVVGSGLALAATVATATAVPEARGEAMRPRLVVAEADRVQQLRFDDNRDTRSATFSIAIDPSPNDGSKPPTPVVAVRGDLKSAQNRRLPSDRLKVTRIAFDGIDAFNVTLTLASPRGQPSGRYAGSVVFGGPQYNAVPVTAIATLRSSVRWSVGVALFGFVCGLVLKALTDLFKASGNAPTRKSFKEYFTRSGYIATAALGLFGAIGAWGFIYLGNDVWGAGDFDDLKLWGTTLAGVVTGTTVADFFAPFKPTV
jgi:hypothetical protein